MYHCHLQIYFTGCRGEVFNIIKEMPPLEHFEHTFTKSRRPEEALSAGADIIFAELEDVDACEAVKALAAAKREDALLILLADQVQIKLLSGAFQDMADIWTLPMAEEEIRFRFLRLQQMYKREKDCRDGSKIGMAGAAMNAAREQDYEQLIQALSSDYNQVCYFDLSTGKGGPLRVHACRYGIVNEVFRSESPVLDDLERYVMLCVYEKDRDFLRHAMSPEELRKELREKQTYTVNYRTNCAGNIHQFQMKAVRVGDWKKNPVAVLGFRNVDDEIRIEMKRRKQLEDALAQANRANKAKSTFLSNMSHDIRTPMNAIVGFTTLAISHIDQKALVKEYLGKIMSSGNLLLSLINDVLDMSRIESGKIHLEETPCSLPDILDELRSIVQADTSAKRLELNMDVVNIENEEIYCDKLRLNQVLLNILSNSVKYTGAGGTVSVRVVEKPGAPKGYACYEFQIKDTGIGMSSEFIEHIFEPFERERNTTISGIQGTGLGMAITKTFVDMMHGSIEVKSEQGQGTEFIVCFTFRLCQTVSREETAAGELPHVRAGRILLAEDNELNREIAEALLSDAGFSVETAENGQIALDMVKSSQPGYYQLVLMDIQMPVMDGYEAARAIRVLTDPELSNIPIIAVTANAFEEDRREALKNGMNGHITKPVDVKALLGILDKMLGEHQVQGNEP